LLTFFRGPKFAAKFKDKNGYEIPVHVLAQKCGKQAQIFTQHAGVRPLACTVHFVAIDDERGAQLYKCDPSGHFFGWKASAIGHKEQEASNMLEKVIKKTDGKGESLETIRKCIDCLSQTLGMDLKPADFRTPKKDQPLVVRPPISSVFYGKIKSQIDYYPDVMADEKVQQPVPLLRHRLTSDD